ncbi:MAG: hypothetical protein M0R37_07730 [Bacteroidales bacterium]|nr:hypothetical protein [Bacteroidales bacterium]
MTADEREKIGELIGTVKAQERRLGKIEEGISKINETISGMRENIMPACATRFGNIEARLDAPGRWFRGRMTRAFDSFLAQGIKLSLIAVLVLLGIHIWP